MKARIAAILLLATLASGTFAQDVAKTSAPPKKVLVELFTSQGCNSCPSANDFLGELAKLGYGPDQVVPVSFHVDYFNEPWVDPFSNKDFSRREMAYNDVLKRKDLYFTPMMMVDGRSPMLGSNKPEALKAIKKSLLDQPGASIKLALSDKDAERTLKVDVSPLGTEIVGRTLMVGVALTEGPITTRVPKGENAGSAASRTLRRPVLFAFEQTKLEALDAAKLHLPDQAPGRRGRVEMPGRDVRPGLGQWQGLPGGIDSADHADDRQTVTLTAGAGRQSWPAWLRGSWSIRHWPGGW